MVVKRRRQRSGREGGPARPRPGGAFERRYLLEPIRVVLGHGRKRLLAQRPRMGLRLGIRRAAVQPCPVLRGIRFASGPTWLVQYTDGAHTDGFDGDYAC